MLQAARLAEAVRDDYDGILTQLEERLSLYLEPSHNSSPASGYPAEVYKYFPHTFPGRWPILAVGELPPVSGTPRLARNSGLRLRAIRLGVLIYELALTRGNPNDEWRDGREVAKSVTRKVSSNWLKKFHEDSLFFGMDVTLSTDFGDHDASGRYYKQPGREDTSILYIRATEVSIEL